MDTEGDCGEGSEWQVPALLRSWLPAPRVDGSRDKRGPGRTLLPECVTVVLHPGPCPLPEETAGGGFSLYLACVLAELDVLSPAGATVCRRPVQTVPARAAGTPRGALPSPRAWGAGCGGCAPRPVCSVSAALPVRALCAAVPAVAAWRPGVQARRGQRECRGAAPGQGAPSTRAWVSAEPESWSASPERPA